MAESRQNINIELTESSKQRLEQLRAWNGMTQKEMVSRLITWFCNQDRVIQQVVLGQIPEEIAPDVAVVMLERMAAVRQETPSPTSGAEADSGGGSASGGGGGDDQATRLMVEIPDPGA